MANKRVEAKFEEKTGIEKRAEYKKDSYTMTRSVRYLGTLYSKGEQVEFTDKNVLRQFIRNNYVI